MCSSGSLWRVGGGVGGGDGSGESAFCAGGLKAASAAHPPPPAGAPQTWNAGAAPTPLTPPSPQVRHECQPRVVPRGQPQPPHRLEAGDHGVELGAAARRLDLDRLPVAKGAVGAAGRAVRRRRRAPRPRPTGVPAGARSSWLPASSARWALHSQPLSAAPGPPANPPSPSGSRRRTPAAPRRCRAAAQRRARRGTRGTGTRGRTQTGWVWGGWGGWAGGGCWAWVVTYASGGSCGGVNAW
jgi:hypothetical protein